MATSPSLSPEYLSADIGGRLVGVAAAFIAINTLFVSLRFYARYLSRTSWGLDDALVLISWILLIGLSALAICFVKYAGVGRHFAALEVVDPAKTTMYWKFLLGVSFYYFAVVALPKLAILALYSRLFTLRPYRITIRLLSVVVTATAIVCAIMCLNLCRPFKFNWDRTVPGGRCLNEQAFYQWGSLPNILTDIIMLVLPLRIVWDLQTSKQVKLGLTLTFLTGSLGLATSILRFATFFQGNATEDGTWSSVDLMTWTVVEPDIYLIAACLPTYRPLLQHLFRRNQTSTKQPLSRYGYSKSRKLPSASNATTSSSDRPKTFPVGFRRLDDDSDVAAYGDEIQLVQTGSRASDPHTTEYQQGQVYIRRDYDVTVAPS